MSRILLILVLLLWSPLAQSQGYINPPQWAKGYFYAQAGTTVTTNILNNRNPPVDLNAIAIGPITTWNIKLPNPAYDAQTLIISCPGGNVTTINLFTSDGSTISPLQNTSCAQGSIFVELQFTQPFNIWRVINFSGPTIQVAGQCDGVQDMQPPIAAAIAFLNVTYNGGTVQLPNGQCLIHNTIVITNSNITLAGYGINATTIIPTFSNADVIQLGSNSTITQGVGVRDLGIAIAGATAGSAINIAGARIVNINRVHLNGVWNGISVDNYGTETAVKITDNVIESCGNDGIVIGANSISPNQVNEVFDTNNTISNCINGFHSIYADGVYSVALSIYHGATSINLNPTPGKVVSHHSFETVVMDSASQSGLLVFCGTGGVVGDINFSKSFFNSNTNAGANIDSSCAPTPGTKGLFGLSIKTSAFENNGSYGAFVGNGQDITFMDNTFAYNSTSSHGTYDGLNVLGQNFIITNNKAGAYGFLSNLGGFTNFQRYGININLTSDYVDVSHNKVVGNQTAGIISNGGSHSRVESNIGYNPVGVTSATYLPSSTATYTASNSWETHYLTGGTVTAVKVPAGGTSICTTTPCTISLGPNETMSVTYSGAPTDTVSIH